MLAFIIIIPVVNIASVGIPNPSIKPKLKSPSSRTYY